MLEIKILNPHLNDKDVLRKTATYLLALAGDEIACECTLKNKPIHTLTVDELPGPGGHGIETHAIKIPSDYPFDDQRNIGDQPGRDSFTIEELKYTETPTHSHVPLPPTIPATSLPCVVPTPHQNDLDSSGLPWDQRIHAGTKTKTADGCWKLKRGANAKEVEEIKDQLTRTMEIPKSPVAIEQDFISDKPDFFTVMAQITSAVTNKQMTHAQVLEIIQSFGLESVPLIAQRPDLLPEIQARIEQFLQG